MLNLMLHSSYLLLKGKTDEKVSGRNRFAVEGYRSVACNAFIIGIIQLYNILNTAIFRIGQTG